MARCNCVRINWGASIFKKNIWGAAPRRPYLGLAYAHPSHKRQTFWVTPPQIVNPVWTPGYRCKIEQPDALQHNRMINSETDILLRVLGSITLRVRSSGSAFCRNYQCTKGKTMQKLTRTCSSDISHTWHCSMFSVCSPSLAQFFSFDYMHNLTFLYTHSPRESGRQSTSKELCLP